MKAIAIILVALMIYGLIATSGHSDKRCEREKRVEFNFYEYDLIFRDVRF